VGVSTGVQLSLWHRPHFQIAESSFTGAINGSNTDFVLPEKFRTGSTRVSRNGVRQSRMAGHYTEITNDTIRFTTAPLSGDEIVIDYAPLN
jgi:hypothetical protein